MSVEVGRGAEQKSALLAVLAGTWMTRVTAHVHNDLGVASGFRLDARLGGARVRGLFKPLPDGGVAGHYMLIENPTGEDESTADCFLRLELDRTDNTLVAYVGNDKSVPAIKGVWSNSGFRFLGDFHDGITMWEAFQAMRPQVTERPSIVSIIVRQASESSWLLDVEFVVEQTYPSQATPVGLRCFASLRCCARLLPAADATV